MKGVKELAYRKWQGGKPVPEQSLELVSLLETEISWSRTSVLFLKAWPPTASTSSRPDGAVYTVV